MELCVQYKRDVVNTVSVRANELVWFIMQRVDSEQGTVHHVVGQQRFATYTHPDMEACK